MTNTKLPTKAQLAKFDRKGLEKLLKDVKLALQAQQEKEDAAKVAQVQKLMKKLHVTDAMMKKYSAKKASTKKGVAKKSVAMYANPDNASQTWTGKGRQPQWFKDKIDAGISRESMEIGRGHLQAVA